MWFILHLMFFNPLRLATRRQQTKRYFFIHSLLLSHRDQNFRVEFFEKSVPLRQNCLLISNIRPLRVIYYCSNIKSVFSLCHCRLIDAAIKRIDVSLESLHVFRVIVNDETILHRSTNKRHQHIRIEDEQLLEVLSILCGMFLR